MPSVTLTNRNVRVQYTVRVPAGVNFISRTVNGRITADLPESPIAAASVVNGSIVASLANVDWSGTKEFTAVNGSIDIELPGETAATVRATAVWGALGNDFGIPVHRMLIGSWFEGNINGGGPRLALTTVNGSIHLRRSPVQ
jgi:DUF4097 and DUF4098 domain-containing protein YvlB